MKLLSVVIITYNEEANIARCIQSVKDIADEVVVVDSYSTDQTPTISQSLGAKVIQHPFAGHIEQKNFAITQASHPFILSLDADEWLSPELVSEIREIKTKPEADGYIFNRLNNYCGKWIRHGAWYPDKKLRLWDSTKGKWQGMNPHDEFKMVSEAHIEYVPMDLFHQSYRTITEHINKTDYFSDLAAQAYLKNNKKSTYFKIYASPVFRFLRDYLIKGGFMDGYYGLVIAWYTASEVHKKYAKLMQLQHVHSGSRAVEK